MKKKIDIFNILRITTMICFIILLVFFIAIVLIEIFYIGYDIKCLREKAEDYCNSQGYNFNVEIDVGKVFFCHNESSRMEERQKFGFLESELEECKK